MIRLSSLFSVLLVSATALATFAVKYQVQTLDDRLAGARKATASEQRELRVLEAEWAYLNRPDMLAAMNQRFLSLAPITRKQLQTAIADIPMRPAPPPLPAPAPPTSPVATTGPVAAVDPAPGDAPFGSNLADAPPPANALPVTPVSLDRPAAPEGAAIASAPGKPILVKASVSPAPRPRPLDRRSVGGRSLDSRSLDRLIAQIAGGR
jgi:hypothetical protein